MTGGDTWPWVRDAGGVRLHVRLTPKASADRIDGVEELADGRRVLKARVRAVPEDGKANAALIRLIAQETGLPKRDIAIQTGARSRLKVVGISGPAGEIEARLGKLVAGDR